MLTYVTGFGSAALLTLLLTPIVRAVALERGWMDAPTEARKVHARPIPRVGGLAIAAGFLAPMLGLALIDNPISQAFYADPLRAFAFLGGGVLMLLLGFVDDLYNLSAKSKFAFQCLVATLLYAAGFQILKIANPFGASFHLDLLAYPLTMLWLVGIMNAINLVDGLDGLAGGVSLFATLTLFAVSLINPNPISAMVSITLAGALVGFLRYNFNPASIFMGDSGSLFLGYILASNGILSATKSSTAAALMIPVLALGLPILDTSMALTRRLLNGQPLFKGDREHIHHRLLARGLSHRETVLALYVACAALGSVALLISFATARQAAMLLSAVAVAAFTASRALGYLDPAQIREAARFGVFRKPRLRQHLAETDAIGRAVRAAATPPEALDALRPLATVADMATLDLRLQLRAGDRTQLHELSVRREEVPGDAQTLVLSFPLDWALGEVEVEGLMTCVWACHPNRAEALESSTYEWLSMVLRDHCLKLSWEAYQRQTPLRLASQPPLGSASSTST